ncbi:MAG: hypothetical protein B6U89_06630, partial [Desulfurococcales archaeon ex4484_58]
MNTIKALLSSVNGLFAGFIIVYTSIREFIITPINIVGSIVISTVEEYYWFIDVLLIILIPLLVYAMISSLLVMRRKRGYNSVRLVLFSTAHLIIFLAIMIPSILFMYLAWANYYGQWITVLVFTTIGFWMLYLYIQLSKPVKHVVVTRFLSAFFLGLSIYGIYNFILTHILQPYNYLFFYVFLLSSLTGISGLLSEYRVHSGIGITPKFLYIWLLVLILSAIRTIQLQAVFLMLFSTTLYLSRLIAPEKGIYLSRRKITIFTGISLFIILFSYMLIWIFGLLGLSEY